MKLVTFILGIFFIIDVSALGKIHNAVPIYTDKPFATIGNINYLYNESPVGKYLESIYVYQNIVSGDNPATHLIVSEYSSYENYEKALEAVEFGKDPEAAFIWYATSNELPFKPLANNQDRILATNNPENWKNNTYFMAINLAVSDPAKYLKAWKKMSAETTKFFPDGSSWLSESYGGTSPFTHNVLISANSYADLMNGLDKVYKSKSFADFQKETAGIRKVIARTSAKRIASFSR